MGWYRSFIGLAVAVLFAAQYTVKSRMTGLGETVMGYVVSLGFFLAVAEFATLALGRRMASRWGRWAGEDDRVPIAVVFAIASLLLALNLLARPLCPYFAVQRRDPPTVPLLILVGWWLAMIWRVHIRGCDIRTGLVALAGLVLGTRVLVLWGATPNSRVGDMLATIDRSLGELLAGRFPYVNFPPAMPYLPGMFLAYLPPKLLGLDLRLANLALDVATVSAILLFPAIKGRSFSLAMPSGRVDSLSLGQVALPFFMMSPVWANYGVNTQYSPSVLASVLLGLSVTSAGPRVQAGALGLAVGTNQMLGACGPILFGHWITRYGPWRATGLAARSMAVFLMLLAPFLAWNPRQFLAVAFLTRDTFSPGVMSGRFTFLPLISRIVPHASFALTLIVIVIASACAMRARHPEAVVAAMAIGLCGTLLFQPVSFSHYFLPVIALMATAPMPLGDPGGDEPGIGAARGRACDRPWPASRRPRASIYQAPDA